MSSGSQPSVVRHPRLGFDVYLVATLITSYFVCIPLARLQALSIRGDLRIYDLLIPLTGILLLSRRTRNFKLLDSTGFGYHRSGRRLIVLVWIGLFLTLALGGLHTFAPAVLRAFRFTGYILTATAVVAVANTLARQRFLFSVFYLNIVAQAVLAFLQGVGLLPNLWPEYWLAAYGASYPVGTLSPHHLQIGLIMLIGIGLTLTLFRTVTNPAVKAALVPILALMLIVSAFSGARSNWLGLTLLLMFYTLFHRMRGALVLASVAACLLLLSTALAPSVANPAEALAQQELQTRLLDRSAADISPGRIRIYTRVIPEALLEHPWLLLTGVGFQNAPWALRGASAAHNNYMEVVVELGLIGLIVYLTWLLKILKNLFAASRASRLQFDRALAIDTTAIFLTILTVMVANEVLWPQYALFTLSGQILTLVGLATACFHWGTRWNFGDRDEEVELT